MKTTELFDFDFVDRELERSILNIYFENPSEETLWIHGKSGFGKTTFLKTAFKTHNNYHFCYLEVKSNYSSIDIITNFIMELQKHHEQDFLSMINEKYKQFYNSTYKKFKVLSSDLFPKISNIVSIIFDFGYNASTICDGQKSSIELITDYISLILKNKKLCVCIDNFSKCDIEVAQLFIYIFKLFSGKDNFRSCIITTTEDLKSNLEQEIYYSLPFRKIEISKLDDYIYFYQILNKIFDLKEFDVRDINYIYNKCEGSPKKLSTLITKLLEKSGIILFANKRKAKIDKNILLSLLQAEHIRFKDEDFEPQQKWILFSYLCLGEYTDIDTLRELAIFVSKRCMLYQAFDEKIFTTGLLELIDNKVLNYTINNTISPCHDLDYKELTDIFLSSQMKSIFSQYTYEFLIIHKEIKYWRYLLCKNAREANIDNWEQLNFHYGKMLSKNKQYYEAQKMFIYLNSYFNKLHIMQILYIALNSYITGNYQLSINQFNIINPVTLRFDKVKYIYYFFLGKSYYNIGRINDATDMLEKCLNFILPNSKECIQTLNVLHMYYFELPSKFEKSKKIFFEIKEKYKETYPEIWANTMRGCHNFLANESALLILKEADSLLQSKVEKGFIKTTIGFIYIRTNQIEMAINQFEIACKDIKDIRIHEYSYAANNLALCYMIKHDFLKAKEYLIEAFLWNRTNYGDIVLQIHLMICSIKLKQFKEAQEYYDYLVSYIEKYLPEDPIMNRKIYMNLAIASKALDKPIMFTAFLNKASQFIENTSSEWRYYVLTQKEQEYKKEKPTALYQLVCDFEPWFLVYAHD